MSQLLMEKTAGKNIFEGIKNHLRDSANVFAKGSRDAFALADLYNDVADAQKRTGIPVTKFARGKALLNTARGAEYKLLSHPSALVAIPAITGIAAGAGTVAYMHHRQKKREAEKNAFDIIEEAYQEKVAETVNTHSDEDDEKGKKKRQFLPQAAGIGGAAVAQTALALHVNNYKPKNPQNSEENLSHLTEMLGRKKN